MYSIAFTQSHHIVDIASHPSQQRRRIFYTAFLLRQKLPPELIPQILDHAEAWVRHSVERRDRMTVTEHGSVSPLVMWGSVPTYESSLVYLSSAKIGKDGLSSGRHPTRKIVFTISSHDQGFSSYPQVSLPSIACPSFSHRFSPRRKTLVSRAFHPGSWHIQQQLDLV